MSNRKVLLFIATSLDGFIATKEESLEWLFKVEGEGDNGYSEFYETVDTIVMGRNTYDWIMKHEQESFPYVNKACYVFTNQERENTEHVTFVNDKVISVTHKLKQQAGKNIWVVGGGQLIHEFIKEDLIDEMIITVAPTLIGQGIPLFVEGEFHLELSLLGTRTFNQFVELHYEVKR